MSMPVKDFRLLEKFLELTFSDNDNEALASIRRANEVLKKHGYNWKQVLGKLVTLEVEGVEQDPQRRDLDDAEVDCKFEAALDGVAPGGYRDFLLSLESQWRRNKDLSPRQWDALEKAIRKEGRR